MRVIGVLSWYEERPGWLAECVASAARLCDHIVAVDGAYGLFPGSSKRPYSNTEQAEVILRTAAGAGIGCTVHANRHLWWGGEVEKRHFMMQLAAMDATPADWLFRIDADEVLSDVPADTKTILARTSLDVAEATIWERATDALPESQAAFRCLFRAWPDIGVQKAHYVVTTGDRYLSGDPQVMDLEPAEAIPGLRLEHRTRERGEHRKALKAEYTRRVIDSGIEKLV